ncbi:uncharacterized protein LOC128221648 [Mya arenaria]|uniref:uncharacterized protein LOC128221648 n=1 Tax=Mya arenaria TaxID=6604 RepID=UPI0022DF9D8F|nr:uncharacterized protein LOC128221648 [Mya arenaria]
MFSIYMVENVPPSSFSQNIRRNCLLFNYGRDFYWESCSLSTTPSLLCSDTNLSDQNQMAQINPTSNAKWAVAVDNCFFGKHFPAAIQSIKNAQFTYQNAQDYWTGIIKTESIISGTYMLDNNINPPVTNAYLEKINHIVYVRFANKNESRKSLCAGGKGKFSIRNICKYKLFGMSGAD